MPRQLTGHASAKEIGGRPAHGHLTVAPKKGSHPKLQDGLNLEFVCY